MDNIEGRVDYTTDSWYAKQNMPTVQTVGLAIPNQKFKADGGKPKPSLLEKDFVHALKAVQATLDYGAQKYEARSWLNVNSERYDDAARRHRVAIDTAVVDGLHGGSLTRDVESGLIHRAHQIICELMMLEADIRARLIIEPDYDYTTFNKPPTDHKV